MDLKPGTWCINGEARTTTLAEHGPRPVIGPPADAAATVHAATTAPWEFVPKDVGFMAATGKLLHANRYLKDAPGKQVVFLTGASFRRIWGQDVTKSSHSDRAVAVSKLTWGDFLTAVYARRLEEDAGIVDAEIKACPHCDVKLGTIGVDLGNLRLRVYDTAPVATYRLAMPWTVRGVAVEVVELRPWMLRDGLERWTKAEIESNELRSIQIVAASITALDGKCSLVTPQILEARDATTGRGLHLDDFEAMSDCILQLSGGPQESAEAPCPHCGKTILVPSQWDQDFT